MQEVVITEDVIILRGLPASGKTTWARAQCAALLVCCRVSKDDIRAMLGLPYSKSSETTVCTIRDKVITTLVTAGHVVIVDDTNIHPRHISTIQGICAHLKVGCQVIDFDTPVDVCIARDAQRANPVGADVIRRMDAEWHGQSLSPANMDTLRKALEL